MKPKILTTVILGSLIQFSAVKLMYLPPETSMLLEQIEAENSVAIQSTDASILPCVVLRKSGKVVGSSCMFAY